MNNLVESIIREIIKESINIDNQNVLYFGNADDPSHVVLEDPSRLKVKTISLNNVMGIDNTVAKFKVEDDEISFYMTKESIPKGDLRIESFALYNNTSFNKNSVHADSFSVLDFAKIMKNQFDFETFKNNNPKYSNFKIEEFPEYQAARDFLENDLIKAKIEEVNPSIFLFPESSSTFNQVLKEMMTEMYPGVEVLSTLKQTMLTSFNVEKAASELKRAKLKQSIVSPDVFQDSSIEIQNQGFSSREALQQVNTEIFKKVERVIRQTLSQGPVETIPAVKIHDIGSLSQMQAWRTYVSNMHTICYDRSVFPIQKIVTNKGEEINVPQIMMSVAFCYGMILFYYAANKINQQNIGSSEQIKSSGIETLTRKLVDIEDAIIDVQGTIENEVDIEKIKRLENQLDILNNQKNEIQMFIENPDELQVLPDESLSDLENTIQAIESHVVSVYRGIAVTKEALTYVQTAEDLFIGVFNTIIKMVLKSDTALGEINNIFTPAEINKVANAISGAIRADKEKRMRSGDKETADMLSLFNQNKEKIITILNSFLSNNLAKIIVANIGQITFPIKVDDLTNNLIKDPLAIFKNNTVEIEPGVFCKMEEDDLIMSGNHPKINKGEYFEITIFKYILDKIIAIDSAALERLIKKKIERDPERAFANILNRANKNFNVPVMKNIIIIDDNIATGATLSIITNEINNLVRSNPYLNFDIEKFQTTGTTNFRTIDRDVFQKLEKSNQDIPTMKKTIESSPNLKNTRGMNIDSLLKNVVCLTPILI